MLIFESSLRHATNITRDLSSLDIDLLILTLLLIVALIVINAAKFFAGKQTIDLGLGQEAVRLDGGEFVKGKLYLSTKQMLSGNPDALVKENGYIIPVERKPLASKVRDRYIAQLLVYMRLIEEFEGQRPPYGYLILGQDCRTVRIENSAQKQAWLQEMLEQMWAIMDGASAQATPHPKKCEKCDVREHCVQRVLVSGQSTDGN